MCLPTCAYRFGTGIIQGAGDSSTGLTIQGNTFSSNWGALPPPLFLNAPVTAISLSAKATAENEDRSWVIKNNKITDVNVGINILYPQSPPTSLTGVDVSLNSIEATRCSGIGGRCLNVNNAAPGGTGPVINVGQNW